ncbi:hypothetical protein OL548_07560 [Lysinibacillus sp. MHQ-1]|nr:hypothetical protein OL548_07560 [Lysinibacillus sp. MHQ-1]
MDFFETPTDSFIDSAILNQIAKATFSTYKQISSHTFELYTTAGHLQNALEKEALEELIKQIEIPFKLAFGYGHSILEATQNAQHALTFSKPFEIYILDEHKKSIGSLSKIRR